LGSLAANITFVDVELLYSLAMKDKNQRDNKRYQRSGEASIPI
jgi:hypothetical protein